MSAAYTYQVVENWPLGPKGRPMGGVVPGVAADSRGRVFVTCRDVPALFVYDRAGTYLDTWGADLLTNRAYFKPLGTHSCSIGTALPS
ncbi:MAG: hypothetical protein GKR89_24270 [Candidatus Latescibacteria bacterium]|nr:hypothetical protein [Candidatus Latescibacterota bacterium]